MDRMPYKRFGDEMDLPEGKTCANCALCRRCVMLFDRMPHDETCVWNPSKFVDQLDVNHDL